MYSNRTPIYSKSATQKPVELKVAHPMFQKALLGKQQHKLGVKMNQSPSTETLQEDDSDSAEEIKTGVGLAGKPGKHNYVAMAELSKKVGPDDLLQFVEQQEEEIKEHGLNINNYDANYEQIQQQRQILQGEKIDGQKGVRYMEKIKEAAEKRKREQSINFEKIAAKQLKREGKNVEGSLTFMTQTYMEMVAKNKKFEAEDEQREEWNRTHSAANKQDMRDFYQRMYNQNMGFGGFGALEASHSGEPGGNGGPGPATTGTAGFSLSLSGPAEEEEEREGKPAERARSRSRDGVVVRENSAAEEPPAKLDVLAKTDGVLESGEREKTEGLSREEKIRLAKEKRRERLEAALPH